MKRIFSYLGLYKGRMAVGLTIKVIGTLMDLVLPWILAYIIDNILKADQEAGRVLEQKDIILIAILGSIMVFCSFVGLFGNIIANRMASAVARDVTRDLRHDLFAKIEDMSSAQTDEVGIPSLISRMSTDTYNVHQMVGMIQRLGVRAPILLLGGIIVTLTLDPILTLVLVSLLPLIVLVVYIISKKGIPLFAKVQIAVDDMVRTIRENITGIRIIKALSREDYETERFKKVNKKLVSEETSSAVTMAKVNPLINFILNAGLIGVILVGAYRVNEGVSSSGKVIAFTSYFFIMLNAMLMITRMFIIFSRAAASGARISYVMDLPQDLKKENIDEVLEDENHIVFNNVTFSYNAKEANAKNVSFKLKRGESLGIIGATGSGKTTLVNLLMRYYDVSYGEILINGKNIKTYEKDELRKMFGVVFQNDLLFSESIYENIAFGRAIHSEKIDEAAKEAQAFEFIETLPKKYENLINSRGVNLSGGQRQRILIARALAGDPEILILDDSSSALDYKTDAKLRQAISKNYSNTTAIIITQRISSIQHCELILVIEEGCIVAKGTHHDLMINSDIYKEIYESQMGGK